MSYWQDINQMYVYPGNNAASKKNYEEAEGIFLKGLTETKNDGYVALNYGDLLIKMENYEKALEMYELALEKLPLPKYKEMAQNGINRTKRLIDSQKEIKNQNDTLTVSLISCTREKMGYACEARGLYSASSTFLKHWKEAQDNKDVIYIISARHGLVKPNQILEPYERSLDLFKDSEKDAWAEFIIANLILELEGKTIACINIRASDTYFEPLNKACKSRNIQCKHFAWK